MKTIQIKNRDYKDSIIVDIDSKIEIDISCIFPEIFIDENNLKGKISTNHYSHREHGWSAEWKEFEFIDENFEKREIKNNECFKYLIQE